MQLLALRAQFPALEQTLDGYPLCYLDTAATSQKPQSVLDAMADFYRYDNANVHRAAHQLSARSTAKYEAVRDKVQAFVNAQHREEIIFTHGTTEAINQVAWGLNQQLDINSVILVDTAAHHANIVPWQQLAQRTGANVIAIPLADDGRIDQQAYQALLAQGPSIVAINHVSNVLGTVNPVQAMVAQAKAAGALTLVDGAQAVAHKHVDMQEIDSDFYVFSGHKMYGPTGVGILYGRYQQLDTLTPLLTGGEMIDQVSFDGTSFNTLPNRLEAGTPAIAEVIGLGAAIDYIANLPQAATQKREAELVNYLQAQLQQLGGITLYAAHNDNCGAVAFNLNGEHHQDVGILLDQQGVAIRCGHHCAMPLMHSLQISGCCRASIGVYTSHEDIDRFIEALSSVKAMLID